MPTTEQDSNIFVVNTKIEGKPVTHRFSMERATAHGMGWWVMERYAVCKRCDRHTFTDAMRTCRPCSKAPDDKVS